MFRALIALVLLLLTVAATAAPAAQRGPASSPPASVKEATPLPPAGGVTLDGKPLFALRIRVLSLSPQDRARTISSRLDKLARDPLFRPDSITVLDGDSASDIAAGDTIVMSVSDADALAEGKARPELARQWSASIRSALEARNREYSMQSLMFGALYTLLATVCLAAALWLMRRYLPRLTQAVSSWRGSYIRSIRFQSVEIVNEERIVALIVTAIQAARTILFFGLLYLYIPLVLSFFPWTRGLAARLFDYILTPVQMVGHAIVSYLPNVFFLLVIAVLTHFAIKLTRFAFAEVGKQTVVIPGFYPDWAEPSFKIVRFMIVAFAVVVAFPYLPGSDSPAFKGVSVFLGLLFSLGSTSAVANVVAGVILTYMRAFKLGDRVKIADTVGDVVEKTLLVTRVRTIKNVDITVPNAMVLGSHITNFSSSAKDYGLILNTRVTIGYDAPWRQVHELLLKAAAATENVLELPAPFVLQNSLDDFYVSYELNAYTDRPSAMASTYSQLHQMIQDTFNQAGVEIMSPHYSSLRDGNHSTVPAQHLPGDYRQPRFRVQGEVAPTEAGSGTVAPSGAAGTAFSGDDRSAGRPGPQETA